MERLKLAEIIVAALGELCQSVAPKSTGSVAIEESNDGIFSIAKDDMSTFVTFSGVCKEPLKAASRLIHLCALAEMARCQSPRTARKIAAAASLAKAPVFKLLDPEWSIAPGKVNLSAAMRYWGTYDNKFTVSVNGSIGEREISGLSQEFTLPKGIQYPFGYVETHDETAVAEILKAYGPKKVRVSSLGTITGPDGARQPVALFWVDPDLPDLEDHFKRIIALRLVEVAEIGAQAALVMLIADGTIMGVKMIGFRDAWAKVTEQSPLKQQPIRPDDTIVMNLSEGERQVTVNPDPELKGNYLEVSGRCPIIVNGTKFGDSGGAAWLMARLKKS